MKIKWLGHASFLITTKEDVKILTDPYDNSIGYKLDSVEAEIVCSSHEHFDHNYFKRVLGTPTIINKAGDYDVKGIKFSAISTFHDKEQGRVRGKNLIIVIDADSLKLCHLGDLGDVLKSDEVSKIGVVDILFIPVGGTFTIDAKDAEKVCSQLNPKVTIPMHYKTKDLTFNIDGVDKFIKGKNNIKNFKEAEVTKETLPASQEIWILSY